MPPPLGPVAGVKASRSSSPTRLYFQTSWSVVGSGVVARRSAAAARRARSHSGPSCASASTASEMNVLSVGPFGMQDGCAAQAQDPELAQEQDQKLDQEQDQEQD
jgi:hypothetical protein